MNHKITLKLLVLLFTFFIPAGFISAEDLNVTVSGPDTAYNGAQYTAAGGAGPYTWVISKGTISQTGVITNPFCGTATITATNSCGTRGQKAVTIVCTPLAISGPDAPLNGTQYNTVGGTAPFTWSVTKGSITQNGVVSVSGQCGSATVSVRDSYGETAIKDVRMPNGKWVVTGVGGQWGELPSACYNCCSAPECTATSGSTKTRYIMRLACGCSFSPPTDNPPWPSCLPANTGDCYSGDEWYYCQSPYSMGFIGYAYKKWKVWEEYSQWTCP